MKKPKRRVDIIVLSDVHLGTYGCHAKELLHYLKSIRPKVVVLNGDIIDIWQFSKSYFPKSHLKVVKYLLGWIGKGVRTYYITGNHDELLRKFTGLKMGSFRLVNKIILDLPENKKAWIFHGDVFDSNQHGSITYLNSGDWIENLSALECVNGEWCIYRYNEDDKLPIIVHEDDDADLNHHQLFNQMLQEFNLMK